MSNGRIRYYVWTNKIPLLTIDIKEFDVFYYKYNKHSRKN